MKGGACKDVFVVSFISFFIQFRRRSGDCISAAAAAVKEVGNQNTDSPFFANDICWPIGIGLGAVRRLLPGRRRRRLRGELFESGEKARAAASHTHIHTHTPGSFAFFLCVCVGRLNTKVSNR